MSIYEKSYILNDDTLLDNLKKNINDMNFSFEEIYKIMQTFEPNSSGFFGSTVLNTLLSKHCEAINNINDIDFCVTTLNNYEYIKSYFENNELFSVKEYGEYFYYDNIKHIKGICNVYRIDESFNKPYLQIVYTDVKNIEEFLQNVDFNITKSAFTTSGFITFPSVLKDISTKKTCFPKMFNRFNDLQNGLTRYMKYKNRGINFIFPKQITWTSSDDDKFNHIDKYILFPIYKFVAPGILSKKITKKSKIIENLKKKLDAKIKESHELRDTNVYLENRIDMGDSEYDDLYSEIRDLEEDILNLEYDNAGLNNEINNLKKSIRAILTF